MKNSTGKQTTDTDQDILARYQNAQTLMQGILTKGVSLNDALFPHWIEGGHCFWYKRDTKDGKEFRLVDAQAATNTSAFDHQALGKALARAAGRAVDHQDLPILIHEFTPSPLRVRLQAWGRQWLFNADTGDCEQVVAAADDSLPSPNGKQAIFIREHNLWIRDSASGKEKALTQDGTDDNSYGRAHYPSLENKPQAVWSPDSKRLFTCQRDTRKVLSRPYIEYAPADGSLRPRLTETKRAYPGDEHMETYRLLAIEVATGQLQLADYQPLPYSGYCFGFFSGNPMGWWAPDSRRAFFVDVARGGKAVRVVELDSHTGATRVLIEETTETFINLAYSSENLPLFLPLPESDELIWFSERTDWGQLYLYDLKTGKLKNTITQGDWLVREVLHFDAKRRELLLQTAGRERDISPYYRDICKVSIDSGELTTLASGDFDYIVYNPGSTQVVAQQIFSTDSANIDGVSPGGQYLTATLSRVDTAPVSVLMDRNGKDILTLETADVSGLPRGWNWPEPVKVKSADGETDIYGVVYRPPGFSPDQRYPVVDFSGGARFYESIPQGSFINGPNYGYNYMASAAIAALGFVVVALEGRGTGYRNKSFLDHGYGDPTAASDATDRIAGIRQLAARFPYMDLDRVGITGTDAIAGPVYGLLDHPDFFKVGVVHCFIEPEFNWATRGETYDGVPIGQATMPTNRAEHRVASLKGKLFLIQGMIDYATPASTFRLVEALQKANKDFDMLCLPNLGHGMGSYTIRRGWDYLVTHLQGVAPPREFRLISGMDFLEAAGAEAGMDLMPA